MKTSVKSNAVKTSLGMVAALALALGAERAQANNLFGIDVSSYQGYPNWGSVHACGPQYAFAKATEGMYYQDATFNFDMNNGKGAGMQMGAYDFARPDLYCPWDEANYFWNFAGSKIIADGHSLYPMVDFEVFNGHVCEPNYTAWFNSWATQVKSRTSHFLRPVIYCSAGNGACDLIEYDLPGGIALSAWIANYNGQNLYTGQPWTCCTCCNAWVQGCNAGNWTYWQVSSTGRICGISGDCDFDAYPLALNYLIAYQGVK
jgi:lysozyme